MSIDSDTLYYIGLNPEGGEESEYHLPPERHVAHLRTLQEISCKLNSGLELKEVLTNILDEAIRAIGAERGCLLLASEATNNLELQLTRHLRPSDWNGKSFKPSRTVIKRVWDGGKPVLTGNALQDPEFSKADSVVNYMLRSVLCVPLHVQGERIGVLYLDNRLKTGQFRADDLALAMAIADQAAIALRNARLHQEALDRSNRLLEVFQLVQSLNQIGLKAQGLSNFPDLLGTIGEELEKFGCPCAILLLSPDGKHIEVQYMSSAGIASFNLLESERKFPTIAINETAICRQVLETRVGKFVPDIGQVMAEFLRHPAAVQCMSAFVAPLIAHNQVLGLLIWGLDHVHPEDSALLMAFANQVASTIEMCRLHIELQQQLAEMQSALATSRALVSEISLNNLLEFITIQAEHLTNASGAAVFLLSENGQWLELATPYESWLGIEPGSRLPIAGSIAELAITTHKVQVSNHAQGDTRTNSIRTVLQLAKLHSLLSIPLVTKDECLGVLLVWNKREGDFTEHDSRLMGLLADHVALALHNARLHAQNRELAIDQERHRLARELHDTVSQSLYSIALTAQTSLKLLGQTNADSKIQDPIDYILQLSKTALTEMREQLYNLYPTALSGKQFPQALKQHCDMLKAQYGLTVELKVEPEPSLVMAQREALYYIAREALWNVVKHAGTMRANVSLTTENSQAIFCIADDGVGFDPSVFVQETTAGLRNMEERTKLLGGIFELQSEPGQGTRVTARFPTRPSKE